MVVEISFFLFILQASNLTLAQSIFIKQIISALAPDPQNNFDSTGSATLPHRLENWYGSSPRKLNSVQYVQYIV